MKGGNPIFSYIKSKESSRRYKVVLIGGDGLLGKARETRERKKKKQTPYASKDAI